MTSLLLRSILIHLPTQNKLKSIFIYISSDNLFNTYSYNQDITLWQPPAASKVTSKACPASHAPRAGVT
jgi:hypothetical protein